MLTVSKYDVCMIGMGPVGTVSGACFAKQGFNVVGVDINPERVKSFLAGEAPFHEPGINDLIKEVQNAGKFTVTSDHHHAISNSRIIMIAVGTPTPEGSVEPDFSQLDSVAKSIGNIINGKKKCGLIIVVRSTVPPGTMRNRITKIIETESGLKAGADFHVAANPEFLREGKAIKDFFDTGRIVVGADDIIIAREIENLYREVSGQRILISLESAEFAKYVDNTWHALKVAFANEIGRICDAIGGNANETSKIFLADKKLNLSEYYLKPGFAFGGSCLPKDVRGLNHLANKYDINVPIINSIMSSNKEHIERGVKIIMERNPRKVGILGIAFKEKVDDIRESPSLAVAELLVKNDIEVQGHDEFYPDGSTVKLSTSNHVLEMKELDYLVKSCDILALFHKSGKYLSLKFGENADKFVDFTLSV